MKKLLLFLTIFSLALALSVSAHARKPAVDPVMGISIDEQKPVPPSKINTGFEFSPSQVPNRTPQSLEKTESHDMTTPLVYITILLFLPAALWFAVMRNIQIAKGEEADKKKEKQEKDEEKKAA